MRTVTSSQMILFVSVLLQKNAECLECYSCSSTADSFLCNQTTSCNTNEFCFLDKVGTSFSSGCASSQQCTIVSSAGSLSGTLVGRDILERNSINEDALYTRQTFQCHECCSTDYCNANLCSHLQPAACVDDETVDCAKMNTLFNICAEKQRAKLVCARFCDLCTMVDGQWSTWNPWTSCSVTCENGTQKRNRSCTNPAPASGGQDCVGLSTETKSCTLEACPVHGGWSMWSQWGSCSVSCDVGMQRRDRNCSNPYPARFGDHCFGSSMDVKMCTPGACANGAWSGWGSWSPCSETCGGGLKTRDRSCTDPPPSSTGRYCSGSPIQVLLCNNIQCPMNVTNGAWASWGIWSSCSDTCGGGIRMRERTCTYPPPSALGANCNGSAAETSPCSWRPCPINATDGHWSNWGAWSVCSETCGGGVTIRERTCTSTNTLLQSGYCSGRSSEASICNKRPCNTVIFSAVGLSSGASEYLIFKNAIVNEGNDYNSSSGIFTCRVSGIYVFTARVTKELGDVIRSVYLHLKVNGITKQRSDNTPFAKDQSDDILLSTYTLYVSGVFHLRKNDIVRINAEGAHVLLHDEYYASFTGHLLDPDN